MGLQLSTPITTARGILQDPDAVRYSDADLLQYANDALDQMTALVPQEFTAITSQSISGYQTEVELSAASSVAFVEVVSNGVGAPVTQADIGAIDRFNPAWRTDYTIAGHTQHWAPVPGNPRRFAIYPVAPLLATSIQVRHVAKPGEYAASADTGVSERFSDAISDYIVARAESRDDEHVNSTRASQFYQSFVAKVKG